MLTRDDQGNRGMIDAGAATRASDSARCYVVLNGSYFREAGKWVGECEELGTATFGDTLEEVQVDLAEMVRLHLNTLEDVGERRRFFEDHGVTMYNDNPPDVSLTITGSERLPIVVQV
jgi:predicted RNase H-like HicB family nuclease